MKKLLLLALMPVLVLVLAIPATAQEDTDPYDCAAQGMRSTYQRHTTSKRSGI